MLNFHSDAKKNFDLKAEKLFALLEENQEKIAPKSSSSFIQSLNKTHTKKLENFSIQNTKRIDDQGKTTAIFFEHNEGEVGLVGSGYADLISLAESIQSLHKIREKLSQEFVEEAIFNWLEKRYKNNSKDIAFTDSLEVLAIEQVRLITTYTPITRTMVEIPFEFCGVTIENLSKENIEKLFPPINSVDPKQKDIILEYSQKLQEEYQGYAAVKINIECEPKNAAKISTEKAKRAADLLGIYSRAMYKPNIQSLSRIKGDKSAATSSTVFLFSKDLQQRTGHSLHTHHPTEIIRYISKSDVENFKRWGLDIHSEIETKKQTSEFEKTVSTFGRLYSKVAFTPDPIEKLIYTLSAIESTLLINSTEPIQQNLAERLAFLLEGDVSKRKEVIKNVKEVYNIRSKYLHHGKSISSDNASQLSFFFGNVYRLFFYLLSLTKEIQNKKELFDIIETRKLS